VNEIFLNQTDENERRLHRFVVLPYLLGIVWSILHPSIALLSGGGCRDCFIDENSLEPTNLRSGHDYLAGIQRRRNGNNTKTLCGSISESLDEKWNLECSTSILKTFHIDLVRLIPTKNAIEPYNEAIALVVPSSHTTEVWSTNHLQSGLLELLELLSEVPWLAKQILLISPTTAEQSLHMVIDAVLDSYLGHCKSTTGSPTEVLQSRVTSAMIRNLLVLDTTPSNDPLLPKNEIRLLPHGKHGVLPNMDLFQVTYSVFSRSPSSGNTRLALNDARAPTLLMHSFGGENRRWEVLVSSKVEQYAIPAAASRWAFGFGNLALFGYNLLRGPFAPHSYALARGIDALTIQGIDAAKSEASSRNFVSNLLQKLEITLHGLSNLHERLHHSTALYLLPSLSSFVKHEEFLIPNLLLVMPSVLRAASLGLRDAQQLDSQIMGWLLFITFTATLFFDGLVAPLLDISKRNASWSLVYAVCLWMFHAKSSRRNRARPQQETRGALRSAQLIANLAAIYVHVPLCFGHVSLAYPSAFLWTPWVAFFDFRKVFKNKIRRHTFLILLILSWPPLTPSPSLLADSVTPYMRFVHFPLHLLLALTWISPLV